MIDWRVLTDQLLATTAQAGIALAATTVVAVACAATRIRLLQSSVAAAVDLANLVPLAALLPISLLVFGRGAITFALAVIACAPVVWPAVVDWLEAADRVVDSGPLVFYSGRRFSSFITIGSQLALGPLPQVLRGGLPLAMFGATLAGFVGAQGGLGVYLSVAMWQGSLSKILAAGSLTTLVCSLGFLAAWSIELLNPGAASIAVVRSQARLTSGRKALLPTLRSGGKLLFAGTFLWYLAAFSAHNPYSVKMPHELFTKPSTIHFLFTEIVYAAGHTILWSISGLAIGFGVAAIVAMLGIVSPLTRTALLPLVFISQTIPLTVLVSSIVALCGRGFAAGMVFASSVTFLAAFVVLEDGGQRISRRYRDLQMVYSRRSSLAFLRFVLIPGMRAYTTRALLVAAPRALLGVILAEYLVLRHGLGGLLYDARGRVEVEQLWLLVGVISAIGVLMQLSLRPLVDPIQDY